MPEIVPRDTGAFGSVGDRSHQVVAGTTKAIVEGRLVLKTLGNRYVIPWPASDTAKPVVGTDFVAGLAMSNSTETPTAPGTVQVKPLVPGVVYLGNPAAPIASQAAYDALVGRRVLVSTSASGVQTILVADGATSGLVIENLDVTKHPGKIAFSIRNAVSYTN